MNEVELYKRHLEFHSKLDYVNTANLSRIKEISKRINFASISTEKQVFDNKGNLYHRKKDDVAGDYISNLTLDYTIIPRELGMIYGTVFVKTENEEETARFKADKFNNYAKFIADLISEKVIYLNELEQFLMVKKNKYIAIDETNFALEYPVDNKHQINDFIEVMLELYREHLGEAHEYKIYPFAFAGNDFIYDCRNLELTERQPNENELFILKYDVKLSDIDTEIPKKFFNLVTENNKSKNNLMLLHAYVIFRKMKLVQAEKWFLMKDFGRSGKGLLMETFNELLKVNKVNFDSLIAGGFESANEWMSFYGADLAHANETGEITKPMMRILRKIATGEIISGRGIGRNAFTFRNKSVLVLDTNENVDTGEITANTTRTVKISLKDRPIHETDEERYKVFEPYWNFVKPNDKCSVASAISFLIVSLDHLKSIGGEFKFNDVTLKHYFSEDELTETQVIMLKVLKEQGFILAGDETLQRLIQEDYKNMKYKKAQQDMKKIGVATRQDVKIEGKTYKAFKIGNQELFDMAHVLVE